MKTIKQVELIEIIHSDVIPNFKELKERTLYVSDKYHTAIHKCLCGCQSQVVTPLNENGWTLYESDGKATLKPSIGNYSFDCKSHYILTKSVANFV